MIGIELLTEKTGLSWQNETGQEEIKEVAVIKLSTANKKYLEVRSIRNRNTRPDRT